MHAIVNYRFGECKTLSWRAESAGTHERARAREPRGGNVFWALARRTQIRAEILAGDEPLHFANNKHERRQSEQQ